MGKAFAVRLREDDEGLLLPGDDGSLMSSYAPNGPDTPTPPSSLDGGSMPDTNVSVAESDINSDSGGGQTRGRSWRCLDPQCPPDCSSCTRPPNEEDEKLFVLAGDPGRKNGEKKLRHIILNCPEWLSHKQREELADRLEQSSTDVSIVNALRAKDPTALRKRHLILLCREWRYRCNLWVHKKVLDTAHADPEGHDHLMQCIDTKDILNHESFGRTITLNAVLEYFQASVGPLLALAEYNFAAPGARKLCLASGDGGRVVTAELVKTQYALRHVYSAINKRVAHNHAHCREVVASMGPKEFQRPDGTPVLASEALHGRECPVEETLQTLGASAAAVLKHIKQTESSLTETAPLNPVEAAWVQSMVDFSLATLEFVARVQSLLTQLLFAPFEFFVRVMVDHVMAACQRAAECFQEKLQERISWMELHLGSLAAKGNGDAPPPSAQLEGSGVSCRQNERELRDAAGPNENVDTSLLIWDNLRVSDTAYSGAFPHGLLVSTDA